VLALRDPTASRSGHDVVAPTLTGLGERAHLLTPALGLNTHVRDLVATFHYEDVTDDVLVAHSYGGLVASAALEEVADRVRHVVFLDAQMPHTGESMLDMVPPALTDQLLSIAEREGDGWLVPPVDASGWGVDDPDLVAWMNQRFTSQPLATYRDRVGTIKEAWRLPGTFVECRPSMLCRLYAANLGRRVLIRVGV
jgi:pimeloyl-ACP methyl ester carboxylesterase